MAEAAPAGPCLRCGRPGASHAAVVAVPSIFQKVEQCPHRPFCDDCADRKEDLTLPQCECRALIASWDPPRPPRPPKPRQARLVHQEAASAQRAQAFAPAQAAAGATSSRRPRADIASSAAASDGAAMEAVVQRAVTALDKLMGTIGSPAARTSNASAASRDLGSARERPPAETDGPLLPRLAAGQATSDSPEGLPLSPRAAAADASQQVGVSSGPVAAAASQTLAQSLQLRGGRPAKPKTPPGSTPWWRPWKS
ncbi:unnamed protein product [Prorocentrum cordatum]|uniref:Uncharacterized protein n=1 Tax=Prorocentrum cordatum TaxID=2364126 RepID=A0ABN9S9Y2_9DINO|nr:unnamed protein product [Polarella glacialis]